VTPRLLHRLCPSCRRGDTWPVGRWHVPLVTTQYLREQRALEEHRAQRRTVREVARKYIWRAEG
jgi:hypothetical protein